MGPSVRQQRKTWQTRERRGVFRSGRSDPAGSDSDRRQRRRCRRRCRRRRRRRRQPPPPWSTERGRAHKKAPTCRGRGMPIASLALLRCQLAPAPQFANRSEGFLIGSGGVGLYRVSSIAFDQLFFRLSLITVSFSPNFSQMSDPMVPLTSSTKYLPHIRVKCIFTDFQRVSS